MTVLQAEQQLFPAENALAQTRFARLQTLGMVEDYQPPEKLLEEIRDETRIVEEFARKAGLVK